MNILLTGSSGRVGRAIYGALAVQHRVVGIDRSPFATTSIVGDFADPRLLDGALKGIDAIIHVAALHAPHVGLVPDGMFHTINVEGTQALVNMAKGMGVKRLVFTSTTALYGNAVQAGACTWIDEHTEPRPGTIYHRTKLEAEQFLQAQAGPDFAVRVIRMSRCFPEPANLMAAYRVHRGIDLRDVATIHAAALTNGGPAFQRYIASGWTPFTQQDCDSLARSPRDLFASKCPELLRELDHRNWPMPPAIDRIYSPHAAFEALGWKTRFGQAEVFRQHDAGDIEVLPVGVR